MRILLILSGILLLSGCGKGLSITRSEAIDVVKAGGGVTVSASDMTRSEIMDIAKEAAQTNARILVVDSDNFTRSEMQDIAKEAPGLVQFED
jgi:enhancing lycopene biosynthesis protein 2